MAASLASSKFAHFNNYTIFEETKCIATLRTNCSTKLESLSEIDFLRFAAIFRICLINADIRS